MYEPQPLQSQLHQLGITPSNPGDLHQLHLILNQILGYPSLPQAQHHHRANVIGSNDLLATQKAIESKLRDSNIEQICICGCCGLMLGNEQLPVCTDLKQINLGIGMMLFFRDFLYHALVFGIVFGLCSMFGLVTNRMVYANNYDVVYEYMCDSSQGCAVSSIGAGSKVLKQGQEGVRLSVVEAWLGVAMVVLWGLANVVKTHYEEKLIHEVEMKRVSASDFTLMIKGVSKEFLGDDDGQVLAKVREVFRWYEQNERSKKQCEYSYEVVGVNVARDLYKGTPDDEHHQKIMQQLQARRKTFRKWIKYRQFYPEFPVDYAQRFKQYQEYNDICADLFEKQSTSKPPLQDKNIIFVTMRHSRARLQIQQKNLPISMLKFWTAFRDNQFPMPNIQILKAPEPEQIKWQNIGFPAQKRTARRIMTWLAAMLLIGISLGINIGIAYIKQKSPVLSFSISIVVTLINVGIQVTIVHLSFLECEYIASLEQSSIAMKIAISQLVNSIGVPIVVAIVSNKSWLKVNGLVDDVFYIGLLNLLVPISSLVDFYEHWLRFVRWWHSHPRERLQICGQKNFNKYWGNYQFDIGYEYAFLIKTSIFTAFFAPMQPIITLFAPFALLFFYFANKLNLFYHYQRPGYHFETTNNTVDTFLLFSPLAYGLGSLFVNNINSEVRLEPGVNGTLEVNILMIFLAFGFGIMVPFRVFYWCVSRPELQNKDYLDKRVLMYVDYDRVNPVTKNDAIAEFSDYIRRLEKEKGISDQAQLVKLYVSTIQKVDAFKPENTFRQSLSRMSAIIGESMLQPCYSLDPDYFNRMSMIKSVSFGHSPAKNDPLPLGEQQLSVSRMRQLPSIMEHKVEETENSHLPQESKLEKIDQCQETKRETSITELQ